VPRGNQRSLLRKLDDDGFDEQVRDRKTLDESHAKVQDGLRYL